MALEDVELRKVPAGKLSHVINILETDNDWEKLISYIPKNLGNIGSNNFESMFNEEHVRIIKSHAELTKKKSCEVFIDEWSTMGRVRPKLSTLMYITAQAGVFRAADELAKMLGVSPPQRPISGPAAKIEISALLDLGNELTSNTTHNFPQNIPASTVQMKTKDTGVSFYNKATAEIQENLNVPLLSELLTALPEVSDNNLNKTSSTANLPSLGTDSSSDNKSYSQSDDKMSSSYGLYLQDQQLDSCILRDTSLVNFNYMELQKITNNFSEQLIQGTNGPIGKIGEGGFGKVFVAYHPSHGQLAIKKAYSKSVSDSQPEMVFNIFNAEIKYLLQFSHKNIVSIKGFSGDGPSVCIVCEYVDGGSLENKLKEKVLNAKQRLGIMLGTAEGLNYLHNREVPIKIHGITTEIPLTQNNFIHGDVKSANILLTKGFIPKLCDFGLAKEFDISYISTSPMGTLAYMSPEHLRGTITKKSDIYSYGIVLLELLTGLRCRVNNMNIMDYVLENCTDGKISSLLDPIIAHWNKAEDVYQLTLKCLLQDWKARPSMAEICDILKEFSKTM